MNQALVITGAANGIGARTAILARRPVAILHRTRADEAGEVAAQIERAGGRAIAIAADIGVEADVVRAFETIDRTFGGVSGLVNNAVDPGPRRRLADLATEDLERVFRTNVLGAFFCTREAAKRMSTNNGGAGGAVVSMSSLLAVKTGAPGAWVHFASSKAALETMSYGLAKELAPEGIRVNVVRCGVIATERRLGQDKDFRDQALAQVAMGRMGDPDEVAKAVLWLLSDDAAYVTGATVDVAGGL